MSARLVKDDGACFHLKMADGGVVKVPKRGLHRSVQEHILTLADGGEVPSITGDPIADEFIASRAGPDGAEAPAPVPNDPVAQALSNEGIAPETGIAPTPVAPAKSPGISFGEGMAVAGTGLAGGQVTPGNLVQERQNAPGPEGVQAPPPAGEALWKGPEFVPPRGGQSAASMNAGMMGPMNAALGDAERASATQRQGVQGVADAEAKTIAAQVPLAQQRAKLAEDMAARTDANLKGMEDDYKQARKEILNQKLDYNRTWTNRSSGEKATALIGIILGGIGSGMTGQPNAALSVLDKQTQNDIAQQEAELGKKKTLFSMNLEMYGHRQTALAATYIQLQEANKAKIEATALQYGGEKAKAAALIQIGEINKSLIPLKMQIAQFQAQQQMMGQFAQGQSQGFGYGSGKNATRMSKLGVDGILEAQAKDQEKTYYLPDGTPMLATDVERARMAANSMGAAKAADEVLGRLISGKLGPVETGRALDAARVELARLLGSGQISESTMKDAENIIGGWAARWTPGVDPYSVARDIIHDRVNATTLTASGVVIPKVHAKGK